MKKIGIKLKCNNIAPLENLDNEFESKSLKMGIFANNGSGKTFISRMFRLLEKSNGIPTNDGINTDATDRLITLGRNKASFNFEISSKGTQKENISISITKTIAPSIPSTNYLYHTFNQDYVEENIKALDYEHSGDVPGFILGKTNIDLTEDNKKLEIINASLKKIKDDLSTKISNYIDKNIAPIANIRRLTEYSQYVSADIFLTRGESNKQALPKSVYEYIKDYDKVKAIPEGLDDIIKLNSFDFSAELFSEINIILSTAYTLSTYSEEFKAEMRVKQGFIEKGLTLVQSSMGRCPFCNQKMDNDVFELINKYNEFINNEEAKTIKRIQELIQEVEKKRKEIDYLERNNANITNLFNEYKTKYIPSCENKSLKQLETNKLDDSLVAIKKLLETKLKDISVSISPDDSILKSFDSIVSILNNQISDNNKLVEEINNKKNTIGEENKTIRKNICKAAYNSWIQMYGNEQKQYVELQKQEKNLIEEIEKKKSSQKKERKKLVADTIKKVLNYFFSGKYTLDENTFRLVFHSLTLEKRQTKNVLSEGEKNIVAFAYYLGDTHTIVEKEDDYSKLFFIIDDPISSMDFNYVYTMAGIIRDIKSLFPKIDTTRYFILTHNTDFIRILSSNKILDKVLLLKNNKMIDWNDNFTVPYINHLLDVYRIAFKNEKANHTTANSIRHIIETIDKFESINSNAESVKEFIKNNFDDDEKSYTYINDLSHGGWRTEQPPMTEDDYKEICEAVIKMVNKHYPNQIKYCKDNS